MKAKPALPERVRSMEGLDEAATRSSSQQPAHSRRSPVCRQRRNPEKIFAVQDPRLRSGLVQQPVQIVASTI